MNDYCPMNAPIPPSSGVGRNKNLLAIVASVFVVSLLLATCLSGIFLSSDSDADPFIKDGVKYEKWMGVENIAVASAYGNPAGNIVILPEVEIDGIAYPVMKIDSSGFYNCEYITSVTIPDSICEIPSGAFGNCTSLTSVTIPNSVGIIYSDAFSGCTSLASLTIPDSVKMIGVRAFDGCSSLTSVTIPDSVYSLGNDAFAGCTSLTTVHIGKSVQTIGARAFENCKSLTSVIIPDSVKDVNMDAFAGCTSLTTVHIGKSVQTISVRVFENCSALTTLTITATEPPTIGSSAFSGVSPEFKVYVQSGSVGKYMSVWSMSNISDYKTVFAPVAKTDLRYTGSLIVGVEPGEGYDIKGNTGTEVGDYTAIAELKGGYVWSDGSVGTLEISWSIAEAPSEGGGVNIALVVAIIVIILLVACGLAYYFLLYKKGKSISDLLGKKNDAQPDQPQVEKPQEDQKDEQQPPSQ